MANTIKLGNGTWATKEGSLLAYNDENNNFKPLPFTTTRDTIATVVNKQGLIETVGSGIPRIDFSNDSKGALLLEPQRLQLIQYSEDFSNAAWVETAGSVTVTSNQFISPNGIQNSDRLQIQSTSSLSVLSSLVSHTINVDITVSAWVKSNTNSIEKIKLFGNYGTPNAVSDEFLVTNIWQRIDFTFTPTGTGNRNVGFYNVNNLSTDIQIYGFQAEQGSFPTSYIPNYGTALGITRSADTASGSGNSTVINSTEGVLYFEGIATNPDVSANSQISISSATNSGDNRVMIAPSSDTQLILRFNAGGTQLVTQAVTVSSLSVNSKIAVRWGNGNYSLYQNGSEVYTQAIASTPTGLAKLNFSSVTETNDFNGKVKDVRVYTTALTDAELIALTTL